MPYYYFDTSYILYVLPGFLLALYAQAKVQSAYKKYGQIASGSSFTGASLARKILDDNGLQGVSIHRVSGNLSDFYNPADKTLHLSDGVYSRSSVAALAVAAHECGHAIQDAKDYFPLKLRSYLVPAAQFGSNFAFILFFAGLVFSQFLMNLGIALYAIAVLFTLVTLPVEYNASHRAKDILGGLLPGNEMQGVNTMLDAAALTYVASLATALGTLLRLLALSGNRRD